MKLKTIFLAFTLILGIGTMQAQESIFDKLGKDKDITSVFISKMMLKMAPKMNMRGANVGGIVNKLDQLEIYNSTTDKAMKLMQAEAKNLQKDKRYELLINVNEGDEKVSFYIQKKNENEFKEFIMFVSEGKEYTIIRMLGNFTLDDIQKVTGGELISCQITKGC